MARVSIYYDKDEKEQFFMVRGDEAYARPTKTTFEVLAVTAEHSSNFDMNVKVNVLHDLGSGSIVLYDNDVPIYAMDTWNSQSGETTIELTGLTYDVEHTFYAQYMGNNQCSGSKSKTVDYTLTNTHRADSTITIDSTTRQFDPNGSFTKTITLTNNSSDSGAANYNKNQTIYIYYDEELKATLTTGTGNTVTFELDDVGDTGLHTIKAVYGGSVALKSKTVTQTVSVGYNLYYTKYPSIHVRNSLITVRTTLENWLGQAVNDQPCNLLQYDTISSEGEIIDTYDTNPKGHAVLRDDDTRKEYFNVETTINNITYSTEIIYIDYIPANYLEMELSTPRLYKNENSILKVTTNSNVERTPVRVYVDDTYEYLYTDSNGVATKNITGTGKGDTILRAEFGGTLLDPFLVKQQTVDDFEQYWIPPNEMHNANYALSSGSIQRLNKYFRLVIPAAPQVSSSSVTLFTLYGFDLDDYVFNLGLFSTSNNCAIQYVPNFQYNGSFDNISISISPSYKKYNNSSLQVRRASNTVEVYDADTLIGTYQEQSGYHPTFAIINPNTSSIYLDFENLYLKGGS